MLLMQDGALIFENKVEIKVFKSPTRAELLAQARLSGKQPPCHVLLFKGLIDCVLE